MRMTLSDGQSFSSEEGDPPNMLALTLSIAYSSVATLIEH